MGSLLLKLSAEVTCLLEKVAYCSNLGSIFCALRDYKSVCDPHPSSRFFQQEEISEEDLESEGDFIVQGAKPKKIKTSETSRVSNSPVFSGKNGEFMGAGKRSVIATGGLLGAACFFKGADGLTVSPSVSPSNATIGNNTFENSILENNTLENRELGNIIFKNNTLENTLSVNETALNVIRTNASASTAPIKLPRIQINISSVEDLEKIGHEERFPLDGHYHQTCDINAQNFTRSVGEKIAFTGCFDGGVFAISNLNRPLFNKVDEHGKLCNINILDSNVLSHQTDLYLGLLLSELTDSNIEHVFVSNSSIVSLNNNVRTGLLVGEMTQATAHNLTVKSSTVNTTGKWAYSGLIAGNLNPSAVLENIVVKECEVSTSGEKAYAGLISGRSEFSVNISNIDIDESKVFTQGDGSPAGAVVGSILLNDAYRDSNLVYTNNIHVKNGSSVKGGFHLFSHGFFGCFFIAVDMAI